MIVPLLLGLMTLSGDPPAADDVCEFQDAPRVVVAEGERLFQYWMEEDRPALFGPVLPESPDFLEFRAQISRAFDTDPLVLLRNQSQHTVGGDAENVRLTLEGRAGSIRPINCLEALLFSVQAERSARDGRPMFSHPTEFMSHVLRKDGQLRIYFYTIDQPGIGSTGIFNDPLTTNLQDGWTVVTTIHNHNFFPGSDRLLGGVVPSAADVQYFRGASQRFGLGTASITNGLHSMDMTRDDFAVFVSATDG